MHPMNKSIKIVSKRIGRHRERERERERTKNRTKCNRQPLAQEIEI